jgi:hypothetical protein
MPCVGEVFTSYVFPATGTTARGRLPDRLSGVITSRSGAQLIFGGSGH